MDKVHLKKIQIRLDLRSESSSCASFRCVFASVNFASSLGKGEQIDSIKTFGRALAFQISLYLTFIQQYVHFPKMFTSE